MSFTPTDNMHIVYLKDEVLSFSLAYFRKSSDTFCPSRCLDKELRICYFQLIWIGKGMTFKMGGNSVVTTHVSRIPIKIK